MKKAPRRTSYFLFYWLLFVLLVPLFSAVPATAAQNPLPIKLAATYAPHLEVTLRSRSGQVSVGDVFTLDLQVTNTGPDEARQVAVYLASHPDVFFTSGPGLSEAGGKEIRFTVERLAVGETAVFPLTARLDGLPKEALTLNASVSTIGQFPTQTDLVVEVQRPLPETSAVAATGQTLSLLNGRVQLDFPSGWTDQETELTTHFLEWHTLANSHDGRVLLLEIEATQQNRSIHAFDKEVQVSLDLTGLVPSDERVADRFALSTRAGEADAWQAVPFTLDPKTGLLTFTTVHFSFYQLTTVTPPESWKPTYNPPGSSPFTGSATYNYPISLPPGIGGLQPALSLSYSSRGVDRKKAPVQGGGTGLGATPVCAWN